MSVCARSDIPIIVITIIIKTISNIRIQLLLYISYYKGIIICVVLCIFKPVDYNIVFLF